MALSATTSPLRGPLSRQDRVTQLRASLLGEDPAKKDGRAPDPDELLKEAEWNADLVVPRKRGSASRHAATGGVGGTGKSAAKDLLSAFPSFRDNEVAAIERKNAFLKETVHRLNAELDRLQADPNKEPAAVNRLLGISKDDPVAPWLVNADRLAPFLAAYDERITELTEKLTLYENEISNVKTKLETVTKENSELRRELEQNVELLISHTGTGSSTRRLDSIDAVGFADEWEDVQEQIQVLTKENDLLAGQQSSTAAELDRTRQELTCKSKELYTALQETTSLKSRISSIQDDLEKHREQCRRLEPELKKRSARARTLEEQKETADGEISKLRTQLHNANEKLLQYKKDIDEVTARYQAHVAETSLMVDREDELVRALQHAEAEVEELKTRLDQANAELEVVKSNHANLLKMTDNLEKRVAEADAKEIEFFENTQKYIAAVEDAKVERDRAIAAEEQRQKEIDRLNEKLMGLPMRYKEKVELEISALRAQYQAEKGKLAEEIRKLETACVDATSQMERAIREKRATEAELEKSAKHIPLENERFIATVEELNSRLRISERERDDATFKLESLHSKYSREENRHEKERYEMAHRMEELYRRLRRAERELEESKEERIELLSKANELQTHIRKLVDEQDKLEREHTAEMVSAARKADTEIKQLSAKFEELSETHVNVTRELHQLLAEQQRLGSRWKEESRSAAERFEQALQDARLQTQQARAKAEELGESLAKALAVKSELLGQLNEEKNSQGRLHALLTSAESRAQTATRQVQEVLTREAELVREKHQLQRDFDRMSLERDRLHREQEFVRRREKHETLRFRGCPDTSLAYADEHEIRELQASIDRHTRPHSVAGVSGERFV